jgi:hypothetical protein
MSRSYTPLPVSAFVARSGTALSLADKKDPNAMIFHQRLIITRHIRLTSQINTMRFGNTALLTEVLCTR